MVFERLMFGANADTVKEFNAKFQKLIQAKNLATDQLYNANEGLVTEVPSTMDISFQIRILSTKT